MLFHVIINPTGASGRAWAVWKEAETYFKECGIPYQVHCSSPEKGITALCQELTQGQPEGGEPLRLVVCGGDGTLGEAVNGIADFSRTQVGLLPAGSSNDLARSMGLPRDLRALLDTVLAGEVRHTADIGEVVCRRGGAELARRRFNVSCGFGFDAAICHDAAATPAKKLLNRLRLGKLIYLLCAFRLILTAPKTELTCLLDQKPAFPVPRTLMAAVMNHRCEGGGFHFCPTADSDDGLLDLCIAAPRTNLAFFAVFPFAYSGRHTRFRLIQLHRAREMELRARKPLWVHTDGDALCMADSISLRALPEKLQLLM